MTTYYRCTQGGNASISQHRDGTATLRMHAGGSTQTRKCKSVTSAKRLLSRWTDGFYSEVEG